MREAKDAHGLRPAQVAALRRRLLAWYDACRRDLPWRRTRDPYAIWVSEVMLQQTRVETVIPYYERFLASYPTVHALAEAPLEEVLAGWSGLGYYRRARSLHAAARQVRDELGGALPKTAEALRAIHGVGPYTAGAIASIAYEEAAPLVDGNVARVLARLFGVDDDPASATGRARLWHLAGALVPAARAGDWNQALMELGATVCTPRHAACASCPVRAGCVALAEGRVDALPTKAARTPPAPWARVALVARAGDAVLLARRVPEGLFGGMWEPPMVDGGEGDEGRLASVLAGTWRRAHVVGHLTHVLSHRRMEITVVAAELRGTPGLVSATEYDALELVTLVRSAPRGVSTLATKVLALAMGPAEARATKPRRRPSRRARPARGRG